MLNNNYIKSKCMSWFRQ